MADQDHLMAAPCELGVVLFQADALASQRYQDIFRSEQRSPEKRLILAVLDDAVQSFIAGVGSRNGKEQRRFEEAQAWIMEREEGWFFSFESICNQLGLDPVYLRSGLQKLKAEADGRRRIGPASSHRLRHARISIGRTTIRPPRSRGA